MSFWRRQNCRAKPFRKREAAGLTVKELAVGSDLGHGDDRDRRGSLRQIARFAFRAGLPHQFAARAGHTDQADVLDKFDHWRKDHPEALAPVSPFVIRTVCPKPKAGRYTLFAALAALAVWLFAAGGIGQITVWLSPAEVARNGSEPIESEPLLPLLTATEKADSEPMVESESAPVEEPVAVVEPTPEPEPVQEAPEPEPEVQVVSAGDEPAAEPVVEADPRLLRPVETDSLLPAVAEAVPLPVDLPEAATANPDDHRLRLTFAGDSWVEITGPDNERLVGDLLNADDVVELIGPGPFNVLVGNVQVTTLTFDNQAIDLSERARQMSRAFNCPRDRMKFQHQIKRRVSRPIQVGSVQVGGDAPISVQTMTNTETTDVSATVAQINAVVEAGADIVRVSVPRWTQPTPLVRSVNRSRCLVADIHFDYKIALKVAELGVDCLRINPGNIGREDRVQAVVSAARDKGIPIRIGVNADLSKKIYRKSTASQHPKPWLSRPCATSTTSTVWISKTTRSA